jgi:capsular exopolysaccharide synthesis family protein
MSIENSFDGNADRLVDLGYYFKVVKSRWFSISLITFLCTLISVLVVLSITPTYRATATLMIEASQKRAVSIEQVVGIDSSAAEYYLTQFEILRSNQVAQKVIDKLDLTKNPLFYSNEKVEPTLVSQWMEQIKNLPLLQPYFSQDDVDLTTETEESVNRAVLGKFKANLSIFPISKTQLVRISFDSSDPQLAAEIANAVGNAFIENNLESKLLATEQATSWINVRLAELKEKLDQSEGALLAFLQSQKLIDDSGIDALASSELSILTERLSNATERRIAAQSLYSALSTSDQPELASLSTMPEISNHPQITNIRAAEIEAEKRVNELSKRYGPKHDKMIQAKAQLASIQKRAETVIAKLINGIEKELQSARQQERLLQAELNSKKDDFQALSVVKREFDTLKREVDTNASLYDLFLTRQKETSAAGDFSSTSASFTDTALVPHTPIKPNKKLFVVLAFIASMGASIVAVLLLDAFNNTIENSRDFENKLGLLPTGTLPRIRDRAYRKKPIDYNTYTNEKFTIFHESVDSIRTSLYLSFRHQQRKLLAISSSVQSEGKTTTAVSLALSFSNLEKVLLIDGDLRKPSVAQRLGLTKNQPGLTNALIMGDPLDECICTIEESNLDVLSGGMLVANPQELLSSEKFEQLLTYLESKYDRIIIDTPPILPVKDAFIIGKLTKGVLLVMKANSTTKSVYKHTLNLFLEHHIHVDGVVLNQVNVPKKGTHTYSEYSSYIATN